MFPFNLLLQTYAKNSWHALILKLKLMLILYHSKEWSEFSEPKVSINVSLLYFQKVIFGPATYFKNVNSKMRDKPGDKEQPQNLMTKTYESCIFRLIFPNTGIKCPQK